MEEEAVCQRVLPGICSLVHVIQDHKETHLAQKGDHNQLHNESFCEFTINLISADLQCLKKCIQARDGPKPLKKYET